MITIKEWRKMTFHSPMTQENIMKVTHKINRSNGNGVNCVMEVTAMELEWLKDNGFQPKITDNKKVEIQL